MRTICIEEHDVTCHWDNQTHRVSHADFFAIVRAVEAAGNQFSAESLKTATGQPAYRIYTAIRWLTGAGAIRRASKTHYATASDFRRRVTLAWYGCEADDLADGTVASEICS